MDSTFPGVIAFAFMVCMLLLGTALRAKVGIVRRHHLAILRSVGATRAVSRISIGASVSIPMYFGASPGRAAVGERPTRRRRTPSAASVPAQV